MLYHYRVLLNGMQLVLLFTECQHFSLGFLKTLSEDKTGLLELLVLHFMLLVGGAHGFQLGQNHVVDEV